jgi:DNA-binding NarL/FixJ family response regulator
VVGAIAVGFTNREIAEKFSISEQTVKHHLRNIFDKTGVSNRLELALFAIKHGLVSTE